MILWEAASFAITIRQTDNGDIFLNPQLPRLLDLCHTYICRARSLACAPAFLVAPHAPYHLKSLPF